MNQLLRDKVEEIVLEKLKKSVEDEAVRMFNEDNLEYQPDDLKNIVDDVFGEDDGELADVKEKINNLLDEEEISQVALLASLPSSAEAAAIISAAEDIYQNVAGSVEEIADRVMVEWHSTYGSALEY